jgi:acyl carrier protein
MASTRDQISQILYKAVSEAMDTPAEALADSTQLVADLGAKSVNLVRIISVIEDELDLDVSFQELRRRKTLGEIVDYLVELSES